MKKCFLFIIISLVYANVKSQNVGIGTNSPVAILDVNSPSVLTSKFNGPNQMFLGFYETNTLRGYLGSYSGVAEDFDIGTSSNNTNGKLHFTITANPKMTIDNLGNVGIGTTSPSASSLLDMSSTTKGFLMPRMTSAQRAAIASPANGLMVYDITTSSFWYYNSSAWTELNTGGGSFSLPYAATDASAESFKITNTISAGIAIFGKATSINPNSIGVLGEGTGGSSVGVRAKNTSGFAIYADATPTSTLSPVIKGISNSATMGVGVMGESNGVNGRGVYGSSLAGIAVEGYGNNAEAIGVKGNSLAGIGVKAYSFSGTALDVEGNLKIAGGNTNPSDGAVLTSDATGNATWKVQKVAFSASQSSALNVVPHNTATTVPFDVENFDIGSDFNTSSAAQDPNTFIAPVGGIYHFDVKVKIDATNGFSNLDWGRLSIYLNGVSIGRVYSGEPSISSSNSFFGMSNSQTVHLNAGDKVKAVVQFVHDASVSGFVQESVFSGHLVYAD